MHRFTHTHTLFAVSSPSHSCVLASGAWAACLWCGRYGRQQHGQQATPTASTQSHRQARLRARTQAHTHTRTHTHTSGNTRAGMRSTHDGGPGRGCPPARPPRAWPARTRACRPPSRAWGRPLAGGGLGCPGTQPRPPGPARQGGGCTACKRGTWIKGGKVPREQGLVLGRLRLGAARRQRS